MVGIGEGVDIGTPPLFEYVPKIGHLATPVEFTDAIADPEGGAGIDPSLHAALTEQLVAEDDLDPEIAPVAVDNALIFLQAVGEHPGVVLSPSKPVDKAWHRFILNTKAYMDHCDRVAGGYIHHHPTTQAERGPDNENPHTTYKLLQDWGYEPDDRVWADAADCGGQRCTNGDCTSGGPPRYLKEEVPQDVVSSDGIL